MHETAGSFKDKHGVKHDYGYKIDEKTGKPVAGTDWSMHEVRQRYVDASGATHEKVWKIDDKSGKLVPGTEHDVIIKEAPPKPAPEVPKTPPPEEPSGMSGGAEPQAGSSKPASNPKDHSVPKSDKPAASGSGEHGGKPEAGPSKPASHPKDHIQPEKPASGAGDHGAGKPGPSDSHVKQGGSSPFAHEKGYYEMKDSDRVLYEQLRTGGPGSAGLSPEHSANVVERLNNLVVSQDTSQGY